MVETIAAASMMYSQLQTQQAVSISLLKDVMDVQTAQADELLRNMEAAVTGLGQYVDILA